VNELGVKPGPRARRILYFVFGSLWLTGVVVLTQQRLNPPNDLVAVGPQWRSWLEVHAALGFLGMIVLGYLVGTHIMPAYRTGEKRPTGFSLLGSIVVLTLTAYGLYYVGNDTLRAVMRNIHVWLGLALPVFWCLHRR
jgi:hypothetical protein